MKLENNLNNNSSKNLLLSKVSEKFSKVDTEKFYLIICT